MGAQSIETLRSRIVDGTIEADIDMVVQHLDETLREIDLQLEMVRSAVEDIYDLSEPS
jgi:hypothetical protein